MQNAWQDEAEAGIKIAGRNINNLMYTDDTTLNGRKPRGTEEFLYNLTLTSIHGYWKKKIALTRWTFLVDVSAFKYAL